MFNPSILGKHAPNGERPMDRETYKELRQRLIEKRDAIHSRLRKMKDDIQQADGPLEKDPEDQAIELENDEVLDRLEPQQRRELSDVLAALERMEEETYGDCVDCGDAIGLDRLEAIPWARRCIQCAEAAELEG